MSFLLVAGARPNFMKIAPLAKELERLNVPYKIVHTGQHYDYDMSKVFFDEFDLSEPDYFLNAGSGSHAEQTAHIMVEFEKVCYKEKPGIVVVVGDVNSTLACSITAKKLHIKVAHVEAGLRSFDISMPEEINRIVTDSISDYLFVTEKSGLENLKKEGKKDSQTYFVGNLMIDTLFNSLDKIKENGKSSNPEKPYAILTLHRPSNVDTKEKLRDILHAVSYIAEDMAIFAPLHPRTQKNIEEFMLDKQISKNIAIRPPMSYLNFLELWKNARLVLTDSGGLQEETTALSIPCFTIRENTERPITIEEGTNVLVGTSSDKIIAQYNAFKTGNVKNGKVPELWDGQAAKRVVKALYQHY